MTPYIGYTGLTDGDTRSPREREFDARVESRKQDIYNDLAVQAQYALRFVMTSERVCGSVHSVVGGSAWIKQSPEDLFDLWLNDVVTDEIRREIREAA